MEAEAYGQLLPCKIVSMSSCTKKKERKKGTAEKETEPYAPCVPFACLILISCDISHLSCLLLYVVCYKMQQDVCFDCSKVTTN